MTQSFARPEAVARHAPTRSAAFCKVSKPRYGGVGAIALIALFHLSTAAFAGTVTIETPANGSTVSSPVLVRATYASTVPAAYMKVWVDHVAGLTIHNTNTFETSLDLSGGAHLIEVQAKDASGTVFTTGTKITVTNTSSTGSTLNYTTWKNDNQRTGQQRAETVLTPSNVNSTHFGMKFSETVDGKIFAQPLYMQHLLIGSTTHNVVFVATEHDSVYAFDADSGGTALWHKSLIPSGATTVPQSFTKGIIHPEYGITGTPVIDAAAGTIFAVTETLENGAAVFRLRALNVTNGSQRPGSGVIITASGFQSKEQLQRPGLLLANGNVYIAFGSQGDIEPYHGWIFAYSATSLAKVAVWNVTSGGSEGAIWMGGSGIAADASSNLYVLTSNGSFNGSTQWSQSFVKLSPNLTVLDHFTPYNWLTLSNGDRDVGSGGVLVVPDQAGAFPHELIGCGKPAPIWVINRDKMGGLESSPSSGQAIQELNSVVGAGAGPQSNDHCFMTPAYWQQNVYFVGNNDVIKAFRLSAVSGKLSTSPTSKGNFVFQFPGAQPVVSSNGSTNGIVWAVSYTATSTGTLAALHAYNATNLATELYRGPSLKGATKYATPTIVNGKVYFGASTKLYVFGLL